MLSRETKTLSASALIMVAVSGLISGFSAYYSYQSTIGGVSIHMQELADLQASSWNAIASAAESQSTILDEMSKVHNSGAMYFGETGEVLLGYKDEEYIHFLFPQRLLGDAMTKIEWSSELAEPMRQGISGKHGVIIDLDYLGNKVLAAHSTIPSLNMGLVVKMHMSEVLASHKTTQFRIIGGSIILVILGTFAIFLMLNPMIKKVEKSELEQKNINRALITSNARLEQFAYAASHDLREPLRSISGFTNIIHKKVGSLPEIKNDEQMQKYFKFIQDGTYRMGSMIEDLLTYSRVGRLGEFETIDVAQIIENIKSDLSVLIDTHKATITYDSMPKIRGKKSDMSHIFQNLITNAIKYNNKKPSVHIGIQSKAKEYLFSVKDNGIGIAEKYRDEIFDLFTTFDRNKGTGAGLAICKKSVEVHGGSIWIESEEGKGSIFYFTINKHLGESNERY